MLNAPFRRLALSFLVLLLGHVPAHALDQEHYEKAQAAVAQGILYLKQSQQSDGSWSSRAGPAVTALAVTVMLDDPRIAKDDPALVDAMDYILKRCREDGGIHDGFLENYNTAICLSTLARANHLPQAQAAVKKAQDYLRNLQWNGQNDPQGRKIDAGHPYFGGAGYGKDGRPDMSNTQVMLQGLYDSGLDCNDPAFQNAIVFITRCQGTPSNQEFADKITPDGGFIYATSLSKEKIGQPESKAGPVTLEDGTTRLATYGSMTYAGFKSYIYAKLPRDDPRVRDAFRWITQHYDLARNPGMRDNPDTPADERMQGYFYYLMTFSRALHAWGEDKITLPDGSSRDWRHDLIDQLASLQSQNGSWHNDTDRWMEANPDLSTCFALIALQEALK